MAAIMQEFGVLRDANEALDFMNGLYGERRCYGGRRIYQYGRLGSVSVNQIYQHLSNNTHLVSLPVLKKLREIERQASWSQCCPLCVTISSFLCRLPDKIINLFRRIFCRPVFDRKVVREQLYDVAIQAHLQKVNKLISEKEPKKFIRALFYSDDTQNLNGIKQCPIQDMMALRKIIQLFPIKDFGMRQPLETILKAESDEKGQPRVNENQFNRAFDRAHNAVRTRAPNTVVLKRLAAFSADDREVHTSLLRHASNLGDGEASYEVGYFLYQHSNNTALATDYLRKAILQGYAKALESLHRIHDSEESYNKDRELQSGVVKIMLDLPIDAWPDLSSQNRDNVIRMMVREVEIDSPLAARCVAQLELLGTDYVAVPFNNVLGEIFKRKCLANELDKFNHGRAIFFFNKELTGRRIDAEQRALIELHLKELGPVH